MTEPRAPELPAQVLERIFSVGPPSAEPAEPLLDARDRVRSQLVCKAWQHALAARRWPLRRLELNAPFAKRPAAVALWMQRVQPGVEQLQVRLGTVEYCLDAGDPPVSPGSPAVRAVHGALLAVQPPGVLHRLSLLAPFPVLERFLPDLVRFTGLRELELRAAKAFQIRDAGYDSPTWSASVEKGSELTWEQVQQLPRSLQQLRLACFEKVQFGPSRAPADEAEAAGRGGHAPCLPALTELHISDAHLVLLNAPLPHLEQLSVSSRWGICLAEEPLHLPRLTSLQLLRATFQVPLRCSTMPALARLETQCELAASDGWAAWQHLTHLRAKVNTNGPQYRLQLVEALAPRLRDLSLYGYRPDTAADVADALVAAGGTQLTQLEFSGLECLWHLPAWPHLQVLLLWRVLPTSVQAQHVALLAAGPSLRRLAFSRYALQSFGRGQASRSQEERQLEELRQALPGCAVELY